MDGTYGEGLAPEAEEPDASGEVHEGTLPESVEEGLPDEAEDVDPDAEPDDDEWAEEHSPLPDEDPEAILEEALTPGPELEEEPEVRLPRLVGGLGRKSLSKRGRLLVKPEALAKTELSPEQRLLILDTWRRSGLPAADFAGLVHVSKHTLYAWKKRFDEEGPAGLLDRPKGGPRRMKLPELTKRTILMLKEANPEWGCQRISDMLLPTVPPDPTRVDSQAGPMKCTGCFHRSSFISTSNGAGQNWARSLRNVPSTPTWHLVISRAAVSSVNGLCPAR